MLLGNFRRFGLVSPKAFGYCLRLQSTQPTSTKQTSENDSSIEQLKKDMGNIQPLTESEINELGSAFDAQTSFSVFPRLEDVKPEELIGNQKFGKKSYFVQRSSNGNLPVYTDYKNSNKIVTEIRKIQGDPIQLRNDLQERLPFIPKKYWKVIMQSKKIIIEGDAMVYVKKVLSTTF